MKKIFKTKKLNVEKIGNIVPQLHIHIIARTIKDSSWPLSVWVTKEKPYTKDLLEKNIKRLKKYF
jgi:diadenosine tetraphosphate (Ap4A) HIT family hydrolase